MLRVVEDLERPLLWGSMRGELELAWGGGVGLANVQHGACEKTCGAAVCYRKSSVLCRIHDIPRFVKTGLRVELVGWGRQQWLHH